MTTATTSAPQASTADRRDFTWARLGSLLAWLPLGLWTVNHLWNNLAAFRGADAWERQVTEYAHPAALGASLVVVLLPLVLHTIWGVQRLFSFKPNNASYGTFGNLKYLLQRLSAVGVLLFIGAHLWNAFLSPRLMHGRPEVFEDIAYFMRYNPPTLLVYLLGTLAVCYHLANGISGFAWTWGLTAGRKSQRRVDAVAVVAGLVMLAMAWGAIFALYQAGEMNGPR